MSGVYFLIVITLWIWLTKLLWTTWTTWRNAEKLNRRWVDAAAIVTGVLWFGASFWYGGGQKYYWDAQVRELCAKDGGVKVYETVKLPAEKFDKWGMPEMYHERVENKAAYRHDESQTVMESALGTGYIYKSEDHYYRKVNPAMIRYHHQAIRRSDGKVLGEAVSYGRGGGDLPGPWAPSNFHCPPTSESSENTLFKKIFVPTNRE